MERQINLIITLQDYMDAVSFLKKTRKEQVAYILYYVTHIAQLRTDMRPDIICHRINDQIEKRLSYYQKINIEPPVIEEEEVRKIMEENPDSFSVSEFGDKKRDRENLDNKTAYILTKAKEQELDKEFNKKLKSMYHRKRVYENYWILLVSLSVFMLLFTIGTNQYNRANKFGISLNEFIDRSDFNSLKDGDKAVYFLFYITEIDKIKNEMSPQSISDRLYDKSNVRISPEVIVAYFKSSEMVVESRNPDEYRISPTGKERIANKIDVNLDYSEKNIIGYILSNTILGYGSLTLTLFFSVGAYIFAIGFNFARMLDIPQ